MLLDAGAELDARWRGASAWAIAKALGLEAFAAELERRGCIARPDDPSAAYESAADRFADLLAVGAPPAAIARRIAVGDDPTTPDAQGMPPLHHAVWLGLPEHCALLIDHDRDFTRENAHGGDLLGTLLHGADFAPPSEQRDHAACLSIALREGALARDHDRFDSGRADLVTMIDAARD